MYGIALGLLLMVSFGAFIVVALGYQLVRADSVMNADCDFDDCPCDRCYGDTMDARREELSRGHARDRTPRASG